MRYLILTYYHKPDGKIDEAMSVARNLKPRDHQTANVILDFKKLEVVKASLNGTAVPRDFNRIVEYYMQHYKATIDRMLMENNLVLVKENPNEESTNNPG